VDRALNSGLREDNGEARCSVAVDAIAYRETEKKIASWDLLAFGRSGGNGVVLNGFSLGGGERPRLVVREPLPPDRGSH
jgi:hypothetical protein